MKELLIMRHAKSDWSNNAIDDFDRELNKRGKKDAPKIGNKLNELNLEPDLIICSPAKRAKETMNLVLEKFDNRPNILFEENIYFGNEESISLTRGRFFIPFIKAPLEERFITFLSLFTSIISSIPLR